MKHLFLEKDKTQPTWVLFHGTGGDEHSLIPIAEALNPHSSILSLRGNVNEQGMLRFFKRYGEGKFDLASLEKESDNIIESLSQLIDLYQLDSRHLIGLGYSNGANILGHVLLTRENPIRKAILFHNMLVRKDIPSLHLEDRQVLMSHGTQDQIVSRESFEGVKELFVSSGGKVATCYLPTGHALQQEELNIASKWLKEMRV